MGAHLRLHLWAHRRHPTRDRYRIATRLVSKKKRRHAHDEREAARQHGQAHEDAVDHLQRSVAFAKATPPIMLGPAPAPDASHPEASEGFVPGDEGLTRDQAFERFLP